MVSFCYDRLKASRRVPSEANHHTSNSSLDNEPETTALIYTYAFTMKNRVHRYGQVIDGCQSNMTAHSAEF